MTAEHTIIPAASGGKGTIVYKLTLTYLTAYHDKDGFVFCLEESDFIALGRLCCAVLDEDTCADWWAV